MLSILTMFASMTDAEKLAYDAQIRREEAEEAEHEKQRLYERSGIGERFFRETLGTYRPRHDECRAAYQTAVKFLNDVRCGRFVTLKLLGSVGVGKTHLAGGVLRETGGLYRTTAMLTAEYNETRKFSAGETELRMIERYANTRLLVIDEVGRSPAVDTERYILYQIINARYEKRRPTILIANMTNREFAAHVQEAVQDRLNESAITVEFRETPSYRTELRCV